MLIALPVVLLGGVATEQCAPPPTPGGEPAGSGSWIATAYGPPWNAINGGGVTATGLNLTAGPPAYEIAVDPAVIPLQTFAHVQPNPFGTTRAFYAGDTGGAIIGRHVDIYDWKGRADQNAWGVRHVNVTPAPNPGSGNLLQEITPAPTTSRARASTAGTDRRACDQLAGSATLATVPGQTARILPDGTAAAPSDAPAAVKLAIAAANEIHTKPYPEPVAHFGSLASAWPAYDCSGAVSFVLYTRRPAQPMARRVRDARILGTPRARHVDHRVRQLAAHLDRDRRARVRHRRLRRPEHPRRQRPPLAARPTREPRRRTDLRRPPPPRAMTPERPTHTFRVSRARVRARRAAVTLAALLVAGELAGCAGIANPYQTDGTATRTTSTARRHDPRRRRRSHARAQRNRPTPSASRDRPPQRRRGTDQPAGGADPLRAALHQLDRRQRRRRPAAARRDLARASPSAGAPSRREPRPRSRADQERGLEHGHASSRSPPGKARPPDSGCSSPASRPPGRATTPACRRPCTSSTPN